MTNLHIVLDTRRAKNDQTFPVYLRLMHNGLSRNLSTKIYVTSDQWNFKKGCVKPNHPHAPRINHMLDSLKVNAQSVLFEVSGELQSLTIDELKTLILNPSARRRSITTFSEFGNTVVERYKTAGKIGSAAAYKGCIQIVDKYVGHRKISLKSINYQFLLDFEAHLSGTGVKVNSIGGYMRHLRAILNLAIAEGILKPEDYPFRKFRIKKERTIKRAISKEEILTVINCDLPEYSGLEETQRWFTFMFHVRGMNFVDMARIKFGDIVNGRLIYRRQKTGKLYNIKLTEVAQGIIAQYTDGLHLKNEDYIFPIIPADVLGEAEREWLRISDARKHFNINLKKLAKVAGIKTNLTSYVIRHSWASIAKFSGIAPAVIGESLGHSDLKTTEVYLAEFEHDVLDRANEIIVGE